MTVIKYIDLFCGLGAFHTAFDKASNDLIKYECVYACDIDKDIRHIYKENYNIKVKKDIRKINLDKIPDFDILCAGFPCQPFSIAGKKEGFKNKDKGNLFFDILKIIDKKKPYTLILENVKNLETIHNGKTFKYIIEELEDRKYIVIYKVLDSKYYNCPQSRQRIYIICSKTNKYKFKNTKNNIIPVSTIIDNNINEYISYKDKYYLKKCKGKGIMIYKLINKETKKGGRQGERIYSINSYGPTICASSGGPGAKTGLYYVNKHIRTLSIAETLQMFNFENTYKYESLKNKNKMLFYLGNSIVVNVLLDIIQNL